MHQVNITTCQLVDHLRPQDVKFSISCYFPIPNVYSVHLCIYVLECSWYIPLPPVCRNRSWSCIPKSKYGSLVGDWFRQLHCIIHSKSVMWLHKRRKCVCSCASWRGEIGDHLAWNAVPIQRDCVWIGTNNYISVYCRKHVTCLARCSTQLGIIFFRKSANT